MSTHHVAKTVATVATFAVAAGGFAATAPTAHAALTPKTVTIKPADYPLLIDEPGKASDVIRVPLILGVNWKVNGTSVALTAGSTTDVPLPAEGAVTVTAEAVANDAKYAWNLAPGTPTQWTYTSTNGPKVDIDASGAAAIWNDVPGAKDSVTLTKLTGITWTYDVDGSGDAAPTTYDPLAFGKKGTITLPATTATTVTAKIIDGYQALNGKDLPAQLPSPVTDAGVVAVPDATLEAAVKVGQNPHDDHKGYGPGSAQETVVITGVAGVKWQIGSAKPVAVTGVKEFPVADSDLKNGLVTIKAVAANTKYSVRAGWFTTLSFADNATVPTVAVSNDLVKDSDLAGTRGDTLTLKTPVGMVWWVGQTTTKKDADGTPIVAYKALRPGKGGLVTFKPVFPKPTAEDKTPVATVHLKPVANRGYVTKLDTDFATTVGFTSDPREIDLANQGVADGTTVTYTPAEGVASWATSFKQTVGTRTSTKKVTVNPAAIRAVNATSMSIDFGDASEPTTTTKTARDYILKQPTP